MFLLFGLLLFVCINVDSQLHIFMYICMCNVCGEPSQTIEQASGSNKALALALSVVIDGIPYNA